MKYYNFPLILSIFLLPTFTMAQVFAGFVIDSITNANQG